MVLFLIYFVYTNINKIYDHKILLKNLDQN